MLPTLIVLVYLASLLAIGLLAFRRGASSAEYMVAGRGIGTLVFALSLFGTHMTSFAMLGASGLAYRVGIGVFGLMASVSAIVVPACLLLIGTRLWAAGQRFGFITMAQYLGHRLDCRWPAAGLGALQALMLIPYIVVGMMGGGEAMEGVSGGAVPYWLGGLIVAAVVVVYVGAGGMRGTALVNAVQTVMFLLFGSIAVYIVARGQGGAAGLIEPLLGRLDGVSDGGVPLTASDTAHQLTRERIGRWYYMSYMLIPLSAIAFPHIAIFCMTARRLANFKATIVAYPLCILLLWGPGVWLGATAGANPVVMAALACEREDVRVWLNDSGEGGGATSVGAMAGLVGALKRSESAGAREVLALREGGLAEQERRAEAERLLGVAAGEDAAVGRALKRLSHSESDRVLLVLLRLYAPLLLAGLLSAAIMACVMATDSQILAISTVVNQDLLAPAAGGRLSDSQLAWLARVGVGLLTVLAYLIALWVRGRTNIFSLAIGYAFSGFASLVPILLAAMYWRRTTSAALGATVLWVSAAMVGTAWLELGSADVAPAVPGQMVALTEVMGVGLTIGGEEVFYRESSRVSFTQYGLLMVVPIFVVACLLAVVVSLLTRGPSRERVAEHFAGR